MTKKYLVTTSEENGSFIEVSREGREREKKEMSKGEGDRERVIGNVQRG